ncbi:MAG: 30S ribosome-binding factor RbfA [Chlamydiales bacterium]|nr:30S ribosome-binding factor RbfA [Chlamydiales bacterium]
MEGRRIKRVNSLLKEVISDTIRNEVKNPHIPVLLTITEVQVTDDLHHAKVMVSLFGNNEAKKAAIAALQSAAGFIAVKASKQVRLRFFPELKFVLDTSVEKQIRIQNVIDEIQSEREQRETGSSTDSN